MSERTRKLVNMRACPFCGRQIKRYSMEMEYGWITKIVANCECGVYFEVNADEKVYADGTPWRFGMTALDKWNTRKETDDEECS